MKRKKLTFAQRAMVLNGALLLLIGIAAGIFLVTALLQKQTALPIRLSLAAVPVILTTAIAFLFKKWMLAPYRYYAGLLKRFNAGQVYREFMDNAGHIFPGMEEMLLRYDKLLNDQKLSYKTKKQSEFIALQNQINPHFLYNTLEAIRGDALSVGMDNIADITEALATFFRYTVTDTGSLVTLEDELDNIDNYFRIQKYRFGNKLEIIYEIPENEMDLLQLQCPKLTMQPIVENAIFHGLEKKSEGGLIQIGITLSGNRVLISIRDNGVGMEEESLDRINYGLQHLSIVNMPEDYKNKKGGIALNNVCRRIKLLFGEEYGIHVYSMAGVGTDVRITLPIVKKEHGISYEGRINSH